MHSKITKVDLPVVSITTVPATEDNFMYLVIDKTTNEAVVVDPVDPEAMLDVIKKEKAILKAVLTTHHHWDHAGGNAKLLKLYGEPLEVYGGDSRVEALSKKVQQGDSIKVGNLSFDCLHTPCHTSGHICYYLKPQEGGSPAVFTGDTLFIAGCGRFFEGTPEEMHEALIQKLGSLPDNTLVFCGHEYTVKNLQFALSIEANNEDAKSKLKWAQDMRSQQKPTVPSTLSEEKQFNPFMRCTLAAMQQTTGTSDAVSCMGKLRASKDKF